MKKIICLTHSLFSDKCYSLSSHLLQLIRGLDYVGEFQISIFSFDVEKTFNDQQLLEYFGCSEFQEKIRLFSFDHLTVKKWMRHLIEADILLCQHYIFSEILAAVKRQKPEIRIVSWIHSIVQEEYLSGSIMFRNDAYPIIRRQNQQVDISDLCVFDSHYDEALGQLDFAGMESSRVVPLVSEMYAYVSESLNARERMFRNGSFILKDLQLLYVGRWDYRKGLDSLISCSFRMYMEHGVKTVLLSWKNAECVFEDETAQRQFEMLCRCGALRFEPWKQNKEQYAEFLCSQRWVAVLPSYYDPFNLAALDCAVLGLPLVLSKRCGVKEVLKEDPGLVFVNPYDKEMLYQSVLAMCKRARTPIPEHEICSDVESFQKRIAELFRNI